MYAGSKPSALWGWTGKLLREAWTLECFGDFRMSPNKSLKISINLYQSPHICHLPHSSLWKKTELHQAPKQGNIPPYYAPAMTMTSLCPVEGMSCGPQVSVKFTKEEYIGPDQNPHLGCNVFLASKPSESSICLMARLPVPSKSFVALKGSSLLPASSKQRGGEKS